MGERGGRAGERGGRAGERGAGWVSVGAGRVSVGAGRVSVGAGWVWTTTHTSVSNICIRRAQEKLAAMQPIWQVHAVGRYRWVCHVPWKGCPLFK